MKNLIFLMVFVIFSGIAIWGSGSFELKSALNLAAGLVSSGIIIYNVIALLIAVIGSILSIIEDSPAKKFFLMAVYLSAVTFVLTYMISKTMPGMLVIGFKAENIVSIVGTLMVTITIILAAIIIKQRNH